MAATVMGRADFDKLAPVVVRDVEVGECVVRLKVMSGRERGQWEKAVQRVVNGSATFDQEFAREKLLVRCIVDKDSKRIYQDDEFKLLAEKPADLIGKLAEIATDMNALKASAVEEAAKNSNATPPSDS
jgi:hypothetical protein